MAYLSIPLKVVKSGLAREDNIKNSIDQAIDMLLNTPRFNSRGDAKYGFVFNNLRFEIFDEHEGVIYNSGDTLYENGLRDLYSKKISGSSKNMNTFAAELKEAIKLYEGRLSNVAVTMTYIREERLVYITVKGIIVSTKADYLYKSTLRVWKSK
jgi:predicted component of type VI protein secretion system